MKLLPILIGAAAVLAIGATSKLAQKPPPALPEKAPKQIQIAPVVPEAALFGKYYFGDGLGANCHLELNADHTFGFRWTGCLGTYDKNAGKWSVEEDRVVLAPEQENRHEGFEGVNTRFVPMVWKKRLYLVDEFEAPGFCSSLSPNGVETALDEIHGQQYVKIDKAYKPEVMKWKDAIPDRFEPFVGKPPIGCKVAKVNREGTVVLDKGAASGLRVGLVLSAKEWYSGDLELVEVLEKTSIAKVGYFFNSNRRVVVGDEFSTGGQYFGPHGTGWTRLPDLPRE